MYAYHAYNILLINSTHTNTPNNTLLPTQMNIILLLIINTPQSIQYFFRELLVFWKSGNIGRGLTTTATFNRNKTRQDHNNIIICHIWRICLLSSGFFMILRRTLITDLNMCSTFNTYSLCGYLRLIWDKS